MSFLGMDVSAVGGAKRGVAETSGVIGEMASKIVNFVNELQQDSGRRWTGPDAEKFFGDFEEFAPLTKNATDELAPHTGVLQRRIEAQLRASGQ